MKTSDLGIQLICRFEGLKTDAYKDAVGIPTIGYGHTKGVRMGMKITKEQAIEFLKEDLVKAENAVNKYNAKYNFSQNQFDALVSFAFNVGSIDQLTAKGTRTIEKIAECIPKYNKAGGKKLQGLVNRRQAELEMFNSGAVAPVSDNSLSDDLHKVAQDVINGKYGNGAMRQIKLQRMGYDYKQVQRLVNQIL
ncbi:glycoside hydrolase family protein, partial [Candidatus Saccharibacteria bacterium]|nr:glycoside hydrolase family protein [Candidatus Saccharibacteria bacterium]